MSRTECAGCGVVLQKNIDGLPDVYTGECEEHLSGTYDQFGENIPQNRYMSLLNGKRRSHRRRERLRANL